MLEIPVIGSRQEKAGVNGTWVNVSNSLYQNSGVNYSANFNKPSGEYFYRLYIMYTSYYGGTYWIYSPEFRVLVVSGPAPTQDRVSNQLGYTYETRIGYFDSDGLQDVYVRRTSGGQAGNGTLDNVILQQFPAYNIEQQAEMVMDRFRLKPGTTEPLNVYRDDNKTPAPAPTYIDLYNFIPYLQGEYIF